MSWTAMLTTVILMMICSTAGTPEVRLVDGDDQCSGIPEVFLNNEWRNLSNYYVYYRTILLLCRELDCGDVVNFTFRSDLRDTLRKQPLVDLMCEGKVSALSECKKHPVSPRPENVNVSVAVRCSDSVRLVDGAGLCSGRVEVKSHQSWTTVCEADFDRQAAEVVCRELGCGSPLTLQGALFGEGKPFGNTVFHCKGSENRLLTCSTSAREEQDCADGRAVGLICSRPKDVRLVDGSDCAGTVQMFYSGEWRRVTADRWSMREATVVCRQLGCGSAVAAPMKVSGIGESGWGFHVACTGLEPAVKECTLLYSLQIRFPVGVICSDSVRLVGGAGRCSGRVEVKTHQSWTTVCEADFDLQDAEVVCRELGCGSPLNLQGALFGEGEHPFGSEEFQCTGRENRLLTCGTSAGNSQKCKPSDAVGLTCSEPGELRLASGSSRCAGTVEAFYNGQWRKVGADNWSSKEAGALCKNMDCGSALAATKTKSDGDTPEVGVLMFCDWTSSNECGPTRVQRIVYFAGVICSELLVQPTVSVSTASRMPRDPQEAELYRGHSFTITCSIQPHYPGGSFHLQHLWTNRSHTQAAVGHSASFFFPAADDSHQGNYSCVYENRVVLQSELFQPAGQLPLKWLTGPFIHTFSSESEPFSLTLTDFPLAPVVVRMLLVPFLMLTTCSLVFLIFNNFGHFFMQNSQVQKRAAAAAQDENIQLNSQQQNVMREPDEGGSREAGQELRPSRSLVNMSPIGRHIGL